MILRSHRFQLLPFLLLIAVAVTQSALAEEKQGPWGRSMPSQPFETEPFHEVRIPDWVQHTLGVGYTLSGQNREQRQRAMAAGVTVSELGFVDPFYVYYDSKLLHKRSPHVPADHVEKEVAQYKELGLKILAVYPPCLQSEAYEKHPDWRRVSTPDGVVPSIDLSLYGHGGMLCLLGPYGDFMTDVLCEIVSKFDVDAFSFDGLHYAGVCYCEHCRRDFQAQFNRPIPAVNMDDGDFRRYQHWADRRMERMVQKMQTRIKKIKPEVALLTWSTNAGRFGHLRDIPRNMPARMNLLFDAPDQEFWLDETNRGATVVPAFANAYIWAATNHRVAFSEPYLMSHGNPYGKDSFPAHEVLRRMLLAVSHGAMPSIAVGQYGALQDAVYQGLAEVQKRKQWLTHKRPEPWAAVVMSDNTRVFYGRHPGNVEQRYLANVLGVFRAALEAHLPITLLNDWNLTPDDLAPFKVLILPNTACLDDGQLQAVRQFVRQGGGLVATADTSLCNEFGDTRDDFGLADVLGASWIPGGLAGDAQVAPLDVNFARGLDERYWQQRKNVFDFELTTGSALETSRLRDLIGPGTVTLKAACTAVASRGETGEVIATVREKDKPQAAGYPAAIVRPFGKGRVVYLPAGIDSGYYLYSYPYQRHLLDSAIRWAAGSAPPVEVDAPMCVHATVMRQQLEGQRLLVHLYNDVNTTAFHALPDNDVPLREETIPIHDIRIRVTGLEITKAHAEPGGVELTANRTAEGITQFVLPRLDVHQIVVLELKE